MWGTSSTSIVWRSLWRAAVDLAHDLEHPHLVRVADSPAPSAPLSTRVLWYSALAAIPAAIFLLLLYVARIQ